MKKFNHWRRFQKALKYRGINPNCRDIDLLVDMVRKRAAGDREVSNILFPIISVLEPDGCWMSHCKNYGGVYNFCNCGLGRVPGRCSIYKEYKERQYARQLVIYLEGYNSVEPAPAKNKYNNPYAEVRDCIGNRLKKKLHRQGATDKYNGLPVRDMKTWKFKLEWDYPTPETINEYYTFDGWPHMEAKRITDKLEISAEAIFCRKMECYFIARKKYNDDYIPLSLKKPVLTTP